MSVEVWARDPAPDELTRTVERMGKRGPLKPLVEHHDAVKFGEKARAAGWAVTYRYARGPLTTRRRPGEPNEDGKLALVSSTRTVDTIGVRAQHPDGRALAAWWHGQYRGGDWWEDVTYGEGWAASPRRNARSLGIRALTSYLTEIEDIEGETVDEDEKHSAIEDAAIERLGALLRGGYEESDPAEAWVDGYADGHAAAAEQAGDSYGEGYAAGVAAVAGRATVRVQTRRRLGSLRTGDVVIGRNGHRYIVGISHAEGRNWAVTANGATGVVHVEGVPSRLVDIEEDLELADALNTLKTGIGASVARADQAVQA